MTLFCRLRSGAMIAAASTLLICGQTMAEADSEGPAVELSAQKIEDEISLTAGGKTFDSLKVAENADFSLDITCKDEDLTDGLDWKLHFVNRTDKDMSVSFSNTAINGWMCPTDEWGVSGWSLAPGEETEADVSWNKEELEKIHASVPEKIAFSVKAYSVEEGSYKYYADSVVTVDFGSEESEEMTIPEEIDVIMDTPDFRFSILEYGKDEEGMPLWTVYLENRSRQTVLFELKDCVLNGFASDPYWSTILLPGLKSLTQISWWNLDLEESGIRNIHDASFKVRVWKEAHTGYNSFVDPVEEKAEVTIETDEEETEETGYQPGDSDIILYDQDGVGLGITKIGYSDDLSYYTIGMYLYNNSDKDLKADVTDILVNGKDSYSDWSRDAAAGTWLTGTVSLDRATLEKMKAEDVRNISMTLLLTDKDGNSIASETYEIDAVSEKAAAEDDLEVSTDEESSPEETETEEAIILTQETETPAWTEAAPETETAAETEAAQTEPATETEAAVTEPATETEAAVTEPATETEAAVTEPATETEAAVTEPAPETEAAQTEAAPETETEAATQAAPETETETEPVTEPVTLPAAETEEETAAPAEEAKKAVYTDEKTVRIVQAALVKAGFEIEKDGQITDDLKNAIERYRGENSLAKNTDIDDELLFKLGVSDSDTMQKIQEALNDLGYDCGEPDGLTGRKTTEAIDSYRDKMGLGQGAVDQELIKSLRIARVFEAADEAETEPASEEQTEPETSEAGTEAAADAEPAGKEFTDEKTVRMVQAALINDGFDIEKDGKIGEQLKEAIERYRGENGLSKGTAIDDELLFKMGVTDSDTLMKVQEALNKLGYDCGEPDGLIGKNTRAAIEDYKNKEDLNGSGIDQAFLDALGISR